MWSCDTVFSHFSFILDFKRLPTVFRVCINILAETYLLIGACADLSWQIYADWGSYVIFFIITFNMQHAVISIHVRDKLHTTDDVTKLLDNFQGLRRGWSSDIPSHTIFLTSQNSEFVRPTHGSQTRMTYRLLRARDHPWVTSDQPCSWTVHLQRRSR